MTAAQSDLDPIDMPALVEEMQAYLEAVDLFRAEGCEPHWANDERGPIHSVEQLEIPWVLATPAE
jgi:hypothetical protein